MDRRDFLKTSLASTAAFTLPSLARAAIGSGAGATVEVTLVAEGEIKTLIDGTSILIWQFRDLGGAGLGDLASALVVAAGDTVNVSVQNHLDRDINFIVPGVLTGSLAVMPGESRIYSFTAPAAGSYLYQDGLNDELSRAMGLTGPLVVMPADGSNRLYPGGSAFDRQYTLVLGELDDRLNRAIADGLGYDMNDYEPNYFTVNGLSYPDTASDTDTLVAMNRGEEVAIRFINAGLITYPMHFHGYHVRVATRDRVAETAVVDKDTVLVGVGECVDVILPVTQSGAYPLHTHYVPGVTANGVYVNPYGGGLIVMSAV
ncbi:MAG: multicopper oxidase domain-containing protein [Thermoanaerobaculia bacterium]